jgi:hypothetical protein
VRQGPVIPPPPRFLIIGVAALTGWFAWAYVLEKRSSGLRDSFLRLVDGRTTAILAARPRFNRPPSRGRTVPRPVDVWHSSPH